MYTLRFKPPMQVSDLEVTSESTGIRNVRDWKKKEATNISFVNTSRLFCVSPALFIFHSVYCLAYFESAISVCRFPGSKCCGLKKWKLVTLLPNSGAPVFLSLLSPDSKHLQCLEIPLCGMTNLPLMRWFFWQDAFLKKKLNLGNGDLANGNPAFSYCFIAVQ